LLLNGTYGALVSVGLGDEVGIGVRAIRTDTCTTTVAGSDRPPGPLALTQ
jgi:hypothetical protein